MDTKLKSSRKIRTILAVLAVLIVTVCSIYAFPLIGKNGEMEYEKQRETQSPDSQLLNELQMGSYVLYYDITQGSGANEWVVQNMNHWSESFEPYRSMADYYAKTEAGEEKNTSRDVELLMNGAEPDAEKLTELQSLYQYYFTMEYDKDGEVSIENVWSKSGQQDEIIKTLLQLVRQYGFAGQEEEYLGEEAHLEAAEPYSPRNFRVVYAIPKEVDVISGEYTILSDEYWKRLHAYAGAGSGMLYVGSLVVLALVMFLLTSNKIWRGTVNYKRRGFWYVMEAAVAGIFAVLVLGDGFIGMNVQYVSMYEFRNLIELLMHGDLKEVGNILEMAVAIAAIYGGWYLSVLLIRPLFALGLREYLRQYSLLYLIGAKGIGWCRSCWSKTREEVSHMDFSDKTIKTIRKIVTLNFLILAVLSCFWFFGIFALLLYSVALFFLIKKQYDRVKEDYQSLMQATTRIAQGELKYEDTRDWGVFEPFKLELAKIRSGFSKAVEEEVKSQRMKTELITNVSHDLKTPLTAITTYIELLKDPDITEEQRNSYIEILEKKSLRLKVLVEDLFEVSKASSDNIRLELMEVDVVNLLKQVCVEHESKFEDMGLSIKWKLPQEKTVHLLDNQKTYRIFENLFTNIEKYAMPGSRVYVEVERTEAPDGMGTDGVEIILKNMSAQELCISGEEITERFVRGDSARTTEGSGLGLAIAKSFTQAQKGVFEVTVDGDLFKVRITF